MKRTHLFSLLLVSLMNAPVAAAADSKQATISPALYQKIQSTERLIADKAYGKAEQQLLAMVGEVKDDGLDQAVVLRSLASVYALKEQYAKASEWLSKAVALNALPDKQQQDALLNLGQLYLASEQYAKAIETLKPWLANNPVPDAQTHVLLANAYTQLKQYRNALPHITKAIQSTAKPEDSWYQLQLALFYELKDYQSAIPLLRKLMAANPTKNEYWSQLVAVYQQLNQYTQAATVKHLAYKKGLLNSEKEILDLVNLFLYAGLPYKAASVLRSELDANRVASTVKNWELLANAWKQARELEKAVKALEMASKLDDKGSLYQQLGLIYYEQENWNAAIAAMNKALAKGGLKQPGQAYMILGMSYYESNNTERARQSFAKAKSFPSDRKNAEQWLSYLSKANETS
ncbi:MAG: tetratricopeptide repeat protein [Methylomicrobium sp.]|nr:tetratricopeptide repeat protein [Methylomicrobium sp.]